MSKIPSMSSKKFVKLLQKGNAQLVRQTSTDHAMYSRVVNNQRYSAPVIMGKKTLDPIYCKRVLKQLQFSDRDIEKLCSSK